MTHLGNKQGPAEVLLCPEEAEEAEEAEEGVCLSSTGITAATGGQI